MYYESWYYGVYVYLGESLHHLIHTNYLIENDYVRVKMLTVIFALKTNLLFVHLLFELIFAHGKCIRTYISNNFEMMVFVTNDLRNE